MFSRSVAFCLRKRTLPDATVITTLPPEVLVVFTGNPKVIPKRREHTDRLIEIQAPLSSRACGPGPAVAQAVRSGGFARNLYRRCKNGLSSVQRALPCTGELRTRCCLHQPPGAGQGFASGASARGGIYACCPPALDLASSQATNFPSAVAPRLSVGTLTGSAQCIDPSDGNAGPLEGLRTTAGPVRRGEEQPQILRLRSG